MNLGEPVRVVFIGCVGEAKRSLETLVEMGERVVAIITLRPDLAATVSGAIRWEAIAEASSIPLHFVRNANDPEAIELIRSLEPDLIYCVGWTQLLRRELLAIPRLGCIGFHASLLPKYRGRAPVNWAIIRGETESGNTMMLLDDGVDTGYIIAQRRFAIDLDDTCATVYDKVAASEVDMIRETMPLIRAGRMPRRPQDHGAATVMPRRRPEDGVMDWNKTAKELHDWIRALTHPYPGAFTTLRGERVFIWKARPLSSGSARPGWWRVAEDGRRLLAGTRDSDLEIERVQVQGETETDGAEFGSRLGASGEVAR